MAKLNGVSSTPSDMPTGVRLSGNHYMERFRALISGPSGCGKTFTAATLSDYWPGDEELRIFEEPLVLKDILWISVDAGALVGLGQYNISVQELNLREDIMCPPRKGETKFYEQDLLRAISVILKACKTLVCENGIKTIVLDTASQLNAEICSYWADPGRRPADDFKYWRRVRDTESAFFPKLLCLPCNLVVLSHEKSVLDGVESAKKRLTALAPQGEHNFALAISGGALGDYYDNLDIAVTLMGSPVPGKKGEFSRKLHPFGGPGRTGKCRLQHLLAKEEEPNLSKLYTRLKNREIK